MITILIAAALAFSALCTTVLVCACIVSAWSNERAPQPPVAQSWEASRAQFERQHGKRMRKFYTR